MCYRSSIHTLPYTFGSCAAASRPNPPGPLALTLTLAASAPNPNQALDDQIVLAEREKESGCASCSRDARSPRPGGDRASAGEGAGEGAGEREGAGKDASGEAGEEGAPADGRCGRSALRRMPACVALRPQTA